MKRILGIDLGTTSIGWALVDEAENDNEKSSIIKLGVRVNPLTVDESTNFEKGKSITTNADRTGKRSMRRNLQRYKLRREKLIEILKNEGFITDETVLSENGSRTTFQTYQLRAKAATEKISLEEFARVLLMINKKRGYKSSRKAKSQDEGQLINGMAVTKKLYDENLTPGQLCFQLLQEKKKDLPDFYFSDLQAEFDKIWDCQKQFYSEILTDELKKQLQNKNEKATWVICEKSFKINGIKRDTKGDELKKENFLWRKKGLSEQLDLEQLAVVLQKINGQINDSSKYLGKISDRSKELCLNKQTVGQYLMNQLGENFHNSLKNQVFYRQNYLNEFNTIWEKQAKFHKELTEKLKQEIRDATIFYQRRLKSQKGLINFCEFESRQIEVEIDGKKKIKTVGSRVIPCSSPLFQEFKIWQNLNNVKISEKNGKEEQSLELKQEQKERLFLDLSIKEKLSKTEALKILSEKDKDLNFDHLEGNKTQFQLFKAYIKIIEMSESSGEYNFSKLSAKTTMEKIENIFKKIGINTEILNFNSEKPLDEQPMYKLWHLLYSFEGDNSTVGNEKLVEKLINLYGFKKEYAIKLANVTFQENYGNLSAKAIRKILPYLKKGERYDLACEHAGYKHSKSSLTKEEIANKILKDKLEILPKNSLRNPVVEKILNQMVNVINSIIDKYGKFDEIRIELARELKKSAEERKEFTKTIRENTTENEEIKKKLQNEFGVNSPSKNDIIRYKLYEELKNNGFKTLYSGTYISRENIFGKEFDIEHIIPKSRLFDNSFSNKTLELRSINIEKGEQTAFDFVKNKYGEQGLNEYLNRIEKLNISKSKRDKLKMKEENIPEGFIERDLRNTQYIAKKARTILEGICRRVVATTGSITDKLRKDWQLMDVMKELNWNKYHELGLTEVREDKDGRKVREIKDWTKRNDHRHHAMDALTIAFTKDIYIQYFNNINAWHNKDSNIYFIRQKYFEGQIVCPPIPLQEFREEAKKHLKDVLVSIKSKNKVVTQNINITKKLDGKNKKVQQTPRGQLHEETIYGSQKRYLVKEETIGAKFDADKIRTITKLIYQKALLKRLEECNNDPKKAFTGKNSLTKNPIYTNDKLQIPQKVKTVTFETVYTIRKEISPSLRISEVIDIGVKKVLEERLKKFNGDTKKAFVNLDEDPIWLNKEKGISIKRVTIIRGISKGEFLHEKKDKDGNLILDENGNKQPVDFVCTGNNHHVAVYRDENGELQEKITSFLEATVRINVELPVVDKDYRKLEGWKFLFTMKQNEYFIFPNKKTSFNPEEIDLFDPGNYHFISPNLFRVQKISYKNYVFRHHLETTIDVSSNNLKNVTWKHIQSTKDLEGIVKVQINHIGQIVSVGEY